MYCKEGPYKSMEYEDDVIPDPTDQWDTLDKPSSLNKLILKLLVASTLFPLSSSLRSKFKCAKIFATFLEPKCVLKKTKIMQLPF